MSFFHATTRRIRRYPLLWWISVAVVAGGVGFAVTSSVSSAHAAAQRYDGLVNVAVAQRDLPAGTKLTATDVRTESRPRAFLSSADVVLSPAERTVTTPIAAGEVITELNAGRSGLSATAAMVSDNERAVPLSLRGFHSALEIGDRVDVLATFEHVATEGEPTVIVAESARVVQIGEDSVMVAVPRSQATKVAFAATRADIVLALSPQ
jgi:Flp pilus assembly protein CpaB